MPAPWQSPTPASLTPDEIAIARRRLISLRMVLAALVVGIVLFATVAILSCKKLVLELPPPSLSILLGGLSILAVFQSFVIPFIARRRITADANANRPNQIEKLCTMWMGTGIVGMAIMESASLLNLLAFFLEDHILNLVLAGLALAGMFIHFPSLNRLLDWLESRLRG